MTNLPDDLPKWARPPGDKSGYTVDPGNYSPVDVVWTHPDGDVRIQREDGFMDGTATAPAAVNRTISATLICCAAGIGVVGGVIAAHFLR